MKQARRIVVPGEWLGLLGGGQLGRMFAMAAQSLGYRVAVLDPARGGPAASVCDEHIEGGYLDAPALENLALQCAAVTTEFENVPAQSLAFLAEHCFTTPSADSVAVAQDRIAEKRFIAGCGIAVVPYAVIESPDDIARAGDDLFPGILKASRLGYDGKGQAHVATRADAQEAFVVFGTASAVLEKRCDLAFEVSVVVARGEDGGTAVYAPAENLHRDGILAVTTVPSPSITPALESEAIAATMRIAHALDYVGVLCVEFFVVRGGDDAARDAEEHGNRAASTVAGAAADRVAGDAGSAFTLLVNEIAPRPHNSGHYTIDACGTSQFAQQARIAAGLPLGDTRRHGAAVMLNLLGDLWFAERATADEVTLPGYVDDEADVDARATADVDRLVANAEAAIASAPDDDATDDDATGDAARGDDAESTYASNAAGDDDGAIDDPTIDDDAVDDAATVVERDPDAEPPIDPQRLATAVGQGEGPSASASASASASSSSSAPRRGDASAGRAPGAASSAEATEPDWRAVLAYPGVNLHLYGKREAHRGRKMGHVTIVAERPDEARRIALEVARVLGIAAW